MPHAIWKGAISFGLVHIPVALYPASRDAGIDFDWLDRRTMDPVGYRRINKRTGKEVAADDIVKGIKQDSGDYVIVSDDEIKAAYPKATQTIEIATFVKAQEIPFFYLEKPYFLSPIGKGDKVYALLRETVAELGVIGIARVVLHTRERLAALVPSGPWLFLNTIRWSNELRSADDIRAPAAGKSATGLKETEVRMARQLVTGMTRPWRPDEYLDRFSDAIRALAARRVNAGKTAQVTPLEAEEAAPPRSNVIDLTELLKRSLRGQGAPSAPTRGGRRPVLARARPNKRTTASRRRTKATTASTRRATKRAA